MPDYQFGLVPMPKYENRLIPDANNWAWDNLGARKTMGICQHTMVGALWSTDNYFRGGASALTDFGIGGATDGADDGLILMWNDPTGKAHPGVSPNRWPWASGPAKQSSGDAVHFIQTYGANAVNGYLVSIERSDGGNPEIAPSPKYIDSIIGLTAYYADQDHIPWDAYPNNPGRGVWAFYWHSEIYGGKTCPAGAKSATDEIQQEVIKVLKAAQTSGTEEEDILADLPKSNYVLDPDLVWEDASEGAVGQLWRQYGEKSGCFNSPGQPWNDDVGGGYKIYAFEGGPVITVKDGKAEIVVKVK